MIRHDDLAAVGDHQLGGGNALTDNALQLMKQDRDIECHAVSDDVHHIGMKGAGRQCVKRKFPVLIDDRVPRIGASLKADDDICGIGEGIRDLSLPFIAPVCTYDSFNHLYLLVQVYINKSFIR